MVFEKVHFIGLLLAIGSALLGESAGLVNDLIDIAIYGTMSIFLLNLSLIINDKLILSKFNVKKEICEDRNIGSGVMDGAMALSTGLIILGAIHGEGHGASIPKVRENTRIHTSYVHTCTGHRRVLRMHTYSGYILVLQTSSLGKRDRGRLGLFGFGGFGFQCAVLMFEPERGHGT